MIGLYLCACSYSLDCVISYDDHPEEGAAKKLDIYLAQLAVDSPEFCSKVKESIAVIEEAFSRYK